MYVCRSVCSRVAADSIGAGAGAGDVVEPSQPSWLTGRAVVVLFFFSRKKGSCSSVFVLRLRKNLISLHTASFFSYFFGHGIDFIQCS